MKNTLIIILSVVIMSAGLKAQVVVKVRSVSPKVMVRKPAKNRAGHIWVKGNWRWSKRANKYIWVKAGWKKSRKNCNWIAGQWVATRGGYRWTPGRWQRI